MRYIKYLKNNGVKHVFSVIYRYKIDIILQKIMGIFLLHRPVKNIIMIESHNDFDSNGGALYEYLIANGYNSKYKIVWLIKHPESVPEDLPKNVECVPEYRPSIKKDYYRWIAKWFTYDQDCSAKLRKDQVLLFMTHGAVGLKDCTGLLKLPTNIDYCLTASDWWLPYDAKQFLLNPDDMRLKICGYPSHDILYTNNKGDAHKIIKETTRKVILWMPTFRKAIGNRKDSSIEEPMGIPLIKNDNEYKELSKFLNDNNIFLIIKIHPKQDLSTLKIYDTNSIKVLTGSDVKSLSIDNYRLMKDADAMISDYSTVAYDFLHLNRPIAYDFSDLTEYTRGIIVKDPHIMMAGHEIRNIDDLMLFINDIKNNIDPYKKERQELFDRVFKYHDGNSCKRVVELLGLTI